VACNIRSKIVFDKQCIFHFFYLNTVVYKHNGLKKNLRPMKNNINAIEIQLEYLYSLPLTIIASVPSTIIYILHFVYCIGECAIGCRDLKKLDGPYPVREDIVYSDPHF
jgi:hypothetical protein